MSWIGLDIGGTRLKGGLLNDAGRVVRSDIEPTRPGQDTEDFERQLDRLVGRLCDAAPDDLQGIGAAITGPVDPRLGCIYLPGKIRGLAGHRTVPYLRRKWGVPVLADNDGRLACFAEWRAGAGRRVDNLLVLTMGTGIGSGVVLDGRLLTDRHFQRGTQCGHLVIDVHGPLCLTGAHGTGESLASVTALVHEVRAHVARGLPTSLPTGIDFPAIIVAVKRRDPVVVEIFERWLDRFAAVILNAFYAYTPDLILLAGGPVKAAPVFLRALERRVQAAAFRAPPGYPIPLRPARLGENAGWIGGALRAHEEFSPQKEAA